MNVAKIILVGAVAFVAVMFAGVADYTHAKSARHAAQAHAQRDFMRDAYAAADQRGAVLVRECGPMPGAGIALTPEQASCSERALASVPPPDKPDLDSVGAAAERGWKLRRALYAVVAAAIAILSGALALVVRNGGRQAARA